jgi:hypothetical protein
MTAGLPGVGIGGIFYLLCAFVMPFAELVNTLRGRTTWKRWQMVLTQFGFFCGIMAGFWITGFLLGKIIVRSVMAGGFSHSLLKSHNLFKIQPLFVSLATLIVVFAALRISNHLWDRRSALSRKRASPK